MRITHPRGAASDSIGRVRPRMVELEDRSLPSGTITGVVYEDVNGNGQYEPVLGLPLASQFGASGAVEPGIAGVTVIAVDAAGVVQGATTTGSSGIYVLAAGGTGPYRIEFSNLPAGLFPGPNGPDNGTTIQFVPDGNSTNASLGLVRSTAAGSDATPLVTSRYVFGDQTVAPNASEAVLVRFPYSAGAPDSTDPGNGSPPNPYLAPSPTTLATAAQIGTTWGLAYNNQSQTIYAAAFTKKFAGYGPNGTGAIYQASADGSSVGLFADLNAIFGPNTAGANFRAGYTPNSNADYFADSFNTGWDAVGKTALGGVDVSDDGRFLFVMNLADRMLYVLPTSGPLNAATVLRVAVPNPVSAANSINPALDFRPFAVEFQNGKVYIGAVNSAESTQNQNNLRAYVLEFDPATGLFRTVLDVALNYQRGTANDFDGTNPISANWLPWSPVFANLDPSVGSFNGVPVGNTIYPQPMLTGLAFDSNNNLILGFRDRTGDQTGVFTPDDPNQQTVLRRGITAGDTLRAAFNSPTGAFTLESGGSVGGSAPSPLQMNNQGPGGGEFYFQDNQPRSDTGRDGPNIHDEVAVGGVAQIPGFPDVAVTTFNPIRFRVPNANNGGAFNRGGVRLFNNTTGTSDRSYQVFESPVPNPGTGFQTFAKANGVGDLVALLDPAPVEIGNRVWFDADRDGIQDPGEIPLAGVTVHLNAPDGTLLATAITDAFGTYYFSNGPGVSTLNTIYGIAGLTFNTPGYTVRLDNPADYAVGGPLSGLQATVSFTGSNAAIDSNGVTFGPTDIRATVNIGGPGQNDHTFDFGFVNPVGPPVPPPLPVAVIGKRLTIASFPTLL